MKVTPKKSIAGAWAHFITSCELVSMHSMIRTKPLFATKYLMLIIKKISFLKVNLRADLCKVVSPSIRNYASQLMNC